MVTINAIKMMEKSRSGKVSRVTQSRVSQTTQDLINKQQKVQRLRHEVWSEEAQTYIKSSIPEEPSLKLRMCLDILPYKKHDPPLQCTVQQSWLDNLGPKMEQKDITVMTSTADTGAQCFLLGRDHLPGLGLGIEDLLPSEISLNCANSLTAGNLGVFFAKVRGEHHETQECVESRTMVYVIEGNIVLVSRAVLETHGKDFGMHPRWCMSSRGTLSSFPEQCWRHLDAFRSPSHVLENFWKKEILPSLEMRLQ